MMRFAQPFALLLLLAIPAIAFLMFRVRDRATPKMLFSSIGIFGQSRPSLKLTLRPLPRALTLIALVMLIIAIARPQMPWRERQRRIEGLDIVLVTDVSQSMRAEDFHPNRLERAKTVMKDFIRGRTNDQIGVVVFGKETFTLCPLTHDYSAVETFIDRIDFDLIDGSLTAVGMGLANAVNKLKDSPSKSKVVILLTDGDNNYGIITPLMAAEAAKQLNVRTYLIGVGSQGLVEIPLRTTSGRWTRTTIESHFDVEALREVAELSGGTFFEARDEEALAAIFDQIDAMERTEQDVNEVNYYDELAHLFILPALIMFGAAFFLEQTWLWSFP